MSAPKSLRPKMKTAAQIHFSLLINLLSLIMVHSLPYGFEREYGNRPVGDHRQFVGSNIRRTFGILIITFMVLIIVVGIFNIVYGCVRDEEIPGGGEGGGILPTAARSGVDQKVILSLPTFFYSDVKGLKIGKSATECAVCLDAFDDDETLRLMPPCSHVFHAECIDTWLSSHTTCPVCRADLSAAPEVTVGFSELGCENADGSGLESPDANLLRLMTWTNRNRPPRSRSTGMSTWRIRRLFPGAFTTRNSSVDADRYALRLPEGTLSRLMRSPAVNRFSCHVDFPRASSSRKGYRNKITEREKRGHRRALTVALPVSVRPSVEGAWKEMDGPAGKGSVHEKNNAAEPSSARVLPGPL